MNKVILELKKQKLNSLLVTNPYNILYLTGFAGVIQSEREAIVIITSSKIFLIAPKLYQAEAKKLESDKIKVLIAAERNDWQNLILKSLEKSGTVGFEAEDLKFLEYKTYKKLLKDKNFKPVENIIPNLRILKTASEIEKIKKAQLISQRSFEQIIKTIKPGQTEEEIADKLIKIMKSFGSNGLAFEPIIASGPNSAKPHHKTGKRKVGKNDVLLMDFGAKYQNYCADLTRTIFIGKAPDEQKNTWHIVKKAQEQAINKIAIGTNAKDVHNTALNIFKKENLQDYFTHSLGHGIGLEVHEKPSISAKSKDKLKNGMVFSVEPGLYKNWGGVRIEDLVYIANDAPQFIGKTAPFIEIA